MFCPNCNEYVLVSQIVRRDVKALGEVDVSYDAICPFCNTFMGRMFWGKLLPPSSAANQPENRPELQDVMEGEHRRGERRKLERRARERRRGERRQADRRGEPSADYTGPERRKGERRQEERRRDERRSLERRSLERRGSRAVAAQAPAEQVRDQIRQATGDSLVLERVPYGDKRKGERRKNKRPMLYDRRIGGQDRRSPPGKGLKKV